MPHVPRCFGTLLQGVSCNSDSEKPMPNGLVAGHAYGIQQVRQTSQNEVLVQLRNPWGQGEWKGAWCDSDPRWTPEMMREMGHTSANDGMFWMRIEDFAKEFDSITFADLVPDYFAVLRAESAWNRHTAGGGPNYPGWKNNPQLLMRVYETSQITISLNQPDTRMMFKTGELDKDDFNELYDTGSGYNDCIGFAVFRGGERKVGYYKRDIIANAEHQSVRTVSLCIPECQPGDYIIVPSTFSPKEMKFRMRIWASKSTIALMDTKGGSEWSIYDASDDSIMSQTQPKDMPSIRVPEEAPTQESVQVRGASQQNCIPKADPKKAQSLFLEQDISALGKATWKVGEAISDVWTHGQDFDMSANNTFREHEMCAVMRPDRTIRFARVERDNRNGTYDLCTGGTEDSRLMYKTGVPAHFICKFPTTGPFPTNLVHQVSMLFDTLDVDNSGGIEVNFTVNAYSGEMATDLGRRLLKEMEIDPEDQDACISALKQIDVNGNGIIEKDEVQSRPSVFYLAR